jgi:hypothetical protein
VTFKELLYNLFGSRSRDSGTVGADSAQSMNITVINSSKETDYTNAIKTNKVKARQLYHNTNKFYTLSAQLVKPIINNNVNFIGIPELTGNKKAIKVVEEVIIDYRKVHKTVEIDGSLFVWPQWNIKKKIIELIFISVDNIEEIFIDPITKEITGYRLSEYVTYATPKIQSNKVQIDYIITKDIVILTIVGTINKVQQFKNPFGMIPIIHFSNDKDIYELYGHSEIENFEPQLKFYHELTYQAGAAQSRDGHPKLKVNTTNPKSWIDNNFGTGKYDEIKGGEATISMESRDLFINGKDEDIAYLYLQKTTGDYDSLAETTFTNIVEGSETPEINFGANIGTSLASVKEYRPVWIKKIEAKQYERTAPWKEVYDIIIMISNFVNLRSAPSNKIEMIWPKPNFASVKEQAEIIKGFSDALEKLVKIGALTDEEIFDTLNELDIFEFMLEYKEHKKVIDDEKKIREKAEETLARAGANTNPGATKKDGNNKSNGKD